MISQAHRFHGHGSLRRTYANGQQTRNAYMSLRYIQNTRRQTFRVAVVVSRKVDKSAVVRNRIRRRIYETIRLNETEITKPYDLIFTVFSSGLTDLSSPRLQKQVKALLVGAGVVNKPGDYRDIVDKKET